MYKKGATLAVRVYFRELDHGLPQIRNKVAGVSSALV